MSQQEEADHRRTWWRSRRGLRELDLLLLPYVEEVYPSLSGLERSAYLRLLESEDPELLEWLTGRAAPADPELAALVGRIRNLRRPPA